MNDEQIQAKLGEIPGWQYQDGQLRKTFRFDDFKAALVFVNWVGEAAEKAKHHPDILIEYNKVTLSLCTHDDEDRVTGKDFNLAGEIGAYRK